MDSATLIVRARRRSGLTQRELAQRGGTSAAAVCLYESGQRIPRTDTLTRLIAACGAQLHVSLMVPAHPVDVEANARSLESVLELASRLPARSDSSLEAPVFARLVEAS